MHIEYVETRNFRNLLDLNLHLSERGILVRGPNAQGKTNLLEALYVCATGRSFRNAPAKHLLKEGTTSGKVSAQFMRRGVRHEVEVLLSPSRRGVKVDGRALGRASKLLELINVVAFFPDDLRIAKGSPEERRRFLDRLVANHEPRFVDASIAYGKALKSRNALLRASHNPDSLLLDTYDEQLLTHGGAIYAGRSHALDSISEATCGYFSQIMKADAQASIRHAAGIPIFEDGSVDAFREQFAEALKTARPKDIKRRLTTVGPHRADLVLSVDGRDARTYASQGQQRALVLALKLAEVRELTQRLGAAPILLLDDVSSELDQHRTELLFSVIDEIAGQVWVSSTGAAPLPTRRGTQILEVSAGAIEDVTKKP